MYTKLKHTLFPTARVIVEKDNNYRVWRTSDHRGFIEKVQQIAGVRKPGDSGGHHRGLLAQFKATDGQTYALDTVDGCVAYLRSINQHVYIFTFESCLDAFDRDSQEGKLLPVWPEHVHARIYQEMRLMGWVKWE